MSGSRTADLAAVIAAVLLLLNVAVVGFVFGAGFGSPWTKAAPSASIRGLSR